jgi:hypothetical protein
LVNTKWDELKSDDEDESVEMCPTYTTSTDHQASTLKRKEDQGREHVVPLQGPVRPVTPIGQTGAGRGTSTCLMVKKEKKSKKKRQAKEAKGQKIEASSSPSRELELLKSELASLVCKYETLANKYVLTPKFGKESDLWVRFDKESVWWKEGYFQRYSAKRSAVGYLLRFGKGTVELILRDWTVTWLNQGKRMDG